MTYTVTTQWLEEFSLAEVGESLALIHTPCMQYIRSPYGGDPWLEDGMDLEQLVRWSDGHKCPGWVA